MKTNIINNNSVKTSICAIVMMFAFNMSAWGTSSITFNKTILSGSGSLSEDVEDLGTVTISGSDLYEYGTPYWVITNYSDEDHVVFYLDKYAEDYGTTSFSTTVTVSYLADAEGTYSADIVVYSEDDSGELMETIFPIAVTLGDCPDYSSAHVTNISAEYIYNSSESRYDATATWDALSGADRYAVYLQYYDEEGTIWRYDGDANLTTRTTYTFTDLTEGTKYRIKVRGTNVACMVATDGDNSDAFTITCPTPAATTITTTPTSTGVTVSWEAVDGATNYAVMILNEAKNKNVSGTENETPPSTSHTFTGLTPNTNYYAAVRTTNGCGANKDVMSTMFTTLQRYAITYYKNDGGETSATEYKDHGISYTVSSDKFSRSGYTLCKWHTLAAGTGGTDYAKGASYTTDAALNLYAVWGGTISFDNNGGSGSMDAAVVVSGGSFSLPSCTFTPPTGKLFKCWAQGAADGTERAVGYSHTVSGDITFYAVWRDKVPVNYVFSCSDLQLDEPANGSDNVLSDVIYLTSTSGQKVRSAAHFRVHGDGLTPSQTVNFTTGDAGLDELYTFRKADGTEVATNASGAVDEEVYIFYQPTATTDGRDVVTSVKAYVERKGDGSGKPKAVVNEERTINGRHLPGQFIIAAKSGGVWYALPSDASVAGPQMGYSFTPDDATTPTQADVAPQTALYSIYAPTADATNPSYVRIASAYNNKTLWSNTSTSKIAIKNNALIGGGSAKGNQYEWRLENTAADSYKLYNNASYGNAGRYLGIKETKWNVFPTGEGVVQDIKILPVDVVSDYIGLTATDWEETAFNFSVTSGTPPDPYDHAQVAYNGTQYTASISGTKLTISDDDFTDAGGFTAAPGSQLLVEWCDDENVVLAQGSVISPIIINSNTVNLSDYDADALGGTDIFVTNKAKLTINENTTVHDVTITSGATLFIDKASESKGATLTLSSGKLALKGGWNSDYSDYDMPRIYIHPKSTLSKTQNAVNFDISVDSRNYYPFAVPFRVKVSDVNYVNSTLAGASTYGKHYVIKEYDGANRAENGAVDANWKVVPLKDEGDADVYLNPGKGYILTAVSIPAYGGGVLRFPMSFANAWTTLGEQATVSEESKNVIEVTHHTGAATEGGGANKRHEGWNMLGVPFMSCYTSGTDMYDGEGSADLMTGRMTLSGDPADPYSWESGDVVYVSVPTHDFSEYIQTDVTSAKLVPGWSFFVQVGTTGNLTFLTTKQREDSDLPIYAPKRKEAENKPTVKTGIVLSSETASDKTTLLISDKYSDEYEIGADLEKMFGNGYTLATYSLNNGTRLAFNAMSTSDAKSAIPIGVRIPADGSYTFSLNARYADADIERLDLIDYETSEVTNLMTSDYTFNATRSQNDERFAINITPRSQTPTDIGDTGIDDTNGVRKILLNETMYIIRDGRVYDATGKRVTTINK